MKSETFQQLVSLAEYFENFYAKRTNYERYKEVTDITRRITINLPYVLGLLSTKPLNHQDKFVSLVPVLHITSEQFEHALKVPRRSKSFTDQQKTEYLHKLEELRVTFFAEQKALYPLDPTVAAIVEKMKKPSTK